MLKQLLLASTVVGSLALAGCGTTTGTTTLSEDQVSQIASLTKTACGFLPTAVSIANILAGGSGLVTSGSQIADLICKAATNQSLSKTGIKTLNIPANINNQSVTIQVTGTFVAR